MIDFLTIAFVLLVSGVVGVLILHDMFLSRLRFLHPDIWEKLGPPSKYFDDGGMAGFAAVDQFFRQPEFQSQCNAELLRLARFTRLYTRVYTVCSLVILGIAWYWLNN